jgi:outer membrane protein TolC
MRARVAGGLILLTAGGVLVGCRTARQYRREADTTVRQIIAEKQKQAVGTTQPFTIERPADTLRRRLLVDQNLPYAGPESLGVDKLEPIKHWPKDNYLEEAKAGSEPGFANVTTQPVKLALLEALQVAARNSRDYQTRKESIFQDALSLDLERDEFRATFTALLDGGITADMSSDKLVAGAGVSPSGSVSQRFKSGAAITSRIGLDLVKLLTEPKRAAMGIAADVSLSMPLLRGSGQYIVAEPLTQAERNVVYDLLEFEQYKRQFAVSIASQYLRVIQQIDSVENNRQSLERSVEDAIRSRRLSESGRLQPNQLDQAIQQELSARERWISSQAAYQDTLDSFKGLLGLPPDALIELDPAEMQRMKQSAELLLEAAMSLSRRLAPTTKPAQEPYPVETRPATMPGTPPATQPAPDPILLEPPTAEGAGRFELPERPAIKLALDRRPDLHVVQGKVYDAQRRVVIAADALRAGLNVDAIAAAGGRRGTTSGASDDADLRFERGSYGAGATLDLPLERTAQRNSYRNSLINLDRSTRAVQAAEDSIKTAIQGQLRGLLQSREGLKTQTMAVAVAERRYRGERLRLDAGRGQMRDVVDAQNSLINAQNALTRALVDYRIAELSLQRDLGVLEVDHEGLWREYSPEEQRP